MSWLGAASKLQSKGSSTAKASNLGGLHARRRLTGAQYFTGEWVAQGIWSVLRPAVRAAYDNRGIVSVVDTSIGSGRLLAEADIDACHLYGIDIDTRCIEAVGADAGSAGARYQFEVGRMEDGVDPVWWTSDPLRRRSPQCHNQDHLMRRSSGNR